MEGLHLALLFFDNSFELVFHMEQLKEEREHKVRPTWASSITSTVLA